LNFINHIKGGVIPTSFIPAVEKGVVDAMRAGPIAGCPVKDVTVTVFDGSYHTVDSSEMAFKLAGSSRCARRWPTRGRCCSSRS